jgi:long-chain acyl-CoA synthetase
MKDAVAGNDQSVTTTHERFAATTTHNRAMALARLDVAQSIPDLLVANARDFPTRVALRHRGDGPHDRAETWATIDWATYASRVDEIGHGLLDLGLQAGDRVAILSGNRAEWHMADLAILSVGAVTVPCYPTSSSSQLAYLLTHSGASVLFVENSEQLNKVLLRAHELPELRAVVLLENSPGLDSALVTTLDELSERGRAHLTDHPQALEICRHSIEPDAMATLVYTSGTTGPPKGAVITHQNVLATVRSIFEFVPAGPDDRFLSFLPLSHIAERTVSHFCQLALGAETWFAGSLATVPDDLQVCRPTLFFAVPRVWEKLTDGILGRIAAQPKPLRAALRRYIELGTRSAAETPSLARADQLLYRALDLSLGRTVRRGLGLDQARVLVSSAAPIHPDRLRWFAGIGLPIAEVWGQTEDCGPATMNPPYDIRIGTVGKALPGIELRVADDAEVLVRGATVCAGYYHDDAATQLLIDADGWMASGDLGVIDADGYLRITGRKKDLIILSSGKNIAPQELETHLELQPLIAKAVVVGEGRSYLVALLTLDAESLAGWAHRRGKIGNVEALVSDPELLAVIGDEVEDANRHVARIEGIKRWRLLPREFTVTGGELTPTLKVKRSAVIAANAELIDELYA